MAGLVINEVFAFTTVDQTGDEGVLGFLSATGWIPMIGADLKRVESLRPIADKIAAITGFTYKIKRFTYAGDIE